MNRKFLCYRTPHTATRSGRPPGGELSETSQTGVLGTEVLYSRGRLLACLRYDMPPFWTDDVYVSSRKRQRWQRMWLRQAAAVELTILANEQRCFCNTFNHTHSSSC